MNCRILAKLSFCFINFDLLFAQKDRVFIIQKHEDVLVKKNWQNAHNYCKNLNGRLAILIDNNGVDLLNNLLPHSYGKLANRIIIKN